MWIWALFTHRCARMAFLATALVLTELTGCTDDAPHSDKHARSSVATPASPPKTAPGREGALNKLWRRAAEQHAIAPPTINRVDHLLEDLVAWRGINTGSIAQDDLISAFGRMVRQYRPWLNDSRATEGAAYWTAYCLMRSVERGSSPADRQATEAYYLSLVDRATTIIDGGVRANLPDDVEGKMDDLIKEGMQHLRRECRLRIRQYATDPVCPAFRSRLSKEDETGFLDRYRDARNLPALEEPRRTMATAEQAFRNQFRSYIENEIGLLLFDLFIRSLDTPLNRTEYWGYMDYRAENADDILEATNIWPAVIRFVPDPEYNEAHGWVRESEQRKNDQAISGGRNLLSDHAREHARPDGGQPEQHP